jgi:hypothetical protein
MRVTPYSQSPYFDSQFGRSFNTRIRNLSPLSDYVNPFKSRAALRAVPNLFPEQPVDIAKNTEIPESHRISSGSMVKELEGLISIL